MVWGSALSPTLLMGSGVKPPRCAYFMPILISFHAKKMEAIDQLSDGVSSVVDQIVT